MGTPETDLESLYAQIHDPELRETIKSFGRSVAKHAQERQAQPLELERHPAQVIQFPLIPEGMRPVTNDVARSALFSCVQGKDRQMVKDTLLATVDGVEIRFTGERFNQDDHDLLMQLVFMAKHKPLGEYVTAPARVILKALGRTTDGRSHARLRIDMTRLVAGTVHLSNANFEYIGHLVDDAAQDKASRYWVYKFNPKLRVLYDPNMYTLIEWKQRQSLRGKDLARWLHLYLATHAAPFPVKVTTLRELSGSRTAQLWKFRQLLRVALDDLKDNGDIEGRYIDDSDLVHVYRGKTITNSQRRYLKHPKVSRNRRKKARV
jgi:hypothetical protein